MPEGEWLYNINEKIIITILEEKNYITYSDGKYEHIENVKNFKFSIKIIFSVSKESIIIISAYPLKRGFNESIL